MSTAAAGFVSDSASDLGSGPAPAYACTAPFEVKAIDAPGRVIEGYAAIFGNLDAYRDVIDPAAFDTTLARKRPQDIGVYLGHEANRLPVGLCLELRVDARGLFTRTRVLPTTEGNDLLVAAQELAAAGRPLGMSIGFYARNARYEQLADGTPVRRLTEVDLVEYSFVGLPANPEARVVAIKAGVGVGVGAGPGWATCGARGACGASLNQRPEAKTAIGVHHTRTDTESSWDGPAAVAAAPNDPAVLRYMHAWVAADGDPAVKASYKFPHHRPGTDTPAVIAAVNNALARLPQANIPDADRPGVERHLRAHRRDAGLEEDKGVDLDLAVLAHALEQLAAETAVAVGAEAGAGVGVQAKAGRVMSQRNLDRLHGIIAGLEEMHAQVCDMGEGCPLADTGAGAGSDTAKAHVPAAPPAPERERLRLRLALVGRGIA